MKIIHTADWHLGKSLKNMPLIDEQAYLLNGDFMKIVDDINPDAVIIAGDVYDRAIPSTDAVDLFDEIITKLNEKKLPILCIAGNHDNASRLNFASKLLTESEFFITTRPQGEPVTVILQDNFGDVYFSLIPFFAPDELRGAFEIDTDERLNSDKVNKIYIDAARKKIPQGKRSVAVAHLFVTGGVSSDSERKFVGAVENVDVKNFADYNYTALGHLHKPQNMHDKFEGNGNVVRYSGSIYKYSTSEVDQNKGVTFVELNEKGGVYLEHLPLTPRRDLCVIKGKVAELCKRPPTDDFIHAIIEDKRDLLFAADKLRESSCPNLLSVEFLNANLLGDDFSDKLHVRENVKPIEHFADFYEYSTNEKLPPAYYDAMEQLIDELDR